MNEIFVDANHYLTDISEVIFSLIEIPENLNELGFELYNRLLSQRPKSCEQTTYQERAAEIYSTLEYFKQKPKISMITTLI